MLTTEARPEVGPWLARRGCAGTSARVRGPAARGAQAARRRPAARRRALTSPRGPSSSRPSTPRRSRRRPTLRQPTRSWPCRSSSGGRSPSTGPTYPRRLRRRPGRRRGRGLGEHGPPGGASGRRALQHDRRAARLARSWRGGRPEARRSRGPSPAGWTSWRPRTTRRTRRCARSTGGWATGPCRTPCSCARRFPLPSA